MVSPSYRKIVPCRTLNPALIVLSLTLQVTLPTPRILYVRKLYIKRSLNYPGGIMYHVYVQSMYT